MELLSPSSGFRSNYINSEIIMLCFSDYWLCKVSIHLKLAIQIVTKKVNTSYK